MNIYTLSEADIGPSLDQRIRECLVTCFPGSAGTFTHTRAWNGCLSSYTIIAEHNAGIAGGIAVHDRTIRVGDQMYRTAGVLNVFVTPEHRKKGLARQLVTTAMDRARQNGYDFGMLFTVDPVHHVYEKAGWTVVADRRITMLDTGGKTMEMDPKHICMTFPLVRDLPPAGDIDIQGRQW